MIALKEGQVYFELGGGDTRAGCILKMGERISWQEGRKGLREQGHV